MKKMFAFGCIIFLLASLNIFSQSIKYKILYEEADQSQYMADVYLTDFSILNGRKVTDILIGKLKFKRYGGLHISFWNKKFTRAQMNNFYDDKWQPPKGTQTFLVNYGYPNKNHSDGFWDIKSIEIY